MLRHCGNMLVFHAGIVSFIFMCFQVFCLFEFTATAFKNRTCFSKLTTPNKHNITLLRYKNAAAFRCNRVGILDSFRSNFQNKETPLNITWKRIRPTFESTSKLSVAQLKYCHANSSCKNTQDIDFNTSDVEIPFPLKDSPSNGMMKCANQRAVTTKNIESTLTRYKDSIEFFLFVFGVISGCFYFASCSNFNLKSIVFQAFLGLFGTALGFATFWLNFSVLFTAYITFKAMQTCFCSLGQIFNLASMSAQTLRGKMKNSFLCLFVGIINLVFFQVAFNLSTNVFVFACVNNIAVLAVCFILLNKESEKLNSFYINGRIERSVWSDSKMENLRCQNKSRISNLDSSRGDESVSIVGLSCRFAGGVNSKDAFWDLLVKGGCVISSYPENRLETLALKRFYNPSHRVPGKHYTLKGAFLDEIAGFDAQFFGISPAECRAMDPQQRLLLQCVYEAIEDAGLRLEDLQNCTTGVYVGLMNLDYGRLLLDDGNVPNIDEFASTGITASTAANRISFSLNLNGPSLTVDTACSSSLTALNIAVTHLKLRECDVAIVCAPNLILARYFHTACCRTGLLAEDGRCKSFDAKGDGYGRGEGMAAVILKPTRTALIDGDDPYAKILACGLNNDGQSAIPMTAPSDEKQADLARRVLKESGLQKSDVQYVETHGTGTAVGDVVEMRSVSEVYANTSSRVLRIGSVKSNINHTESTAGLAGIIKVCLMIKNGYYVPTVNIQELKPQLKIAQRKMVVQTKLEPWAAVDGKPRTAAVCSYGYGGANAHAIVQEVQSTRQMGNCLRKRDVWILTLSARSREALKMMAERFSNWFDTKIDSDDRNLMGNICFTLNNRRSVHSHKLSLTSRSFEQAASLLQLFAKDDPGWQKFIAVNDSSASFKKLAFIYGGQGSCWYGMTKELIRNETAFRESLEEIDKILAKFLISWSLVEILGECDNQGLEIEENPIAQMALFAVHHGMTQLLKSWDITPSAVVGHSLGEISAACAAHVFSLEEAVQLILLRSNLHESCSTSGRMMAVRMSPEAAKELLESLDLVSRVSVAAVNSPVDVLLSGDQSAIQIIEDYLQRSRCEVFHKKLGTTRAFHSREMDCIKYAFIAGIDRIKLSSGGAKILFYSTVTGTQISRLTPCHWWRNIREPALFSSALANMIADGYKTFVEINVAPQFPRYVQEIASHFRTEKSTEQAAVTVIETLPKRSEKDRYLSFLRCCPATLYTRGYPMSWDKIQGSGTKEFIRCPSYPWQERKYWYRECQPAEHVGPLIGETNLPVTQNAPENSEGGTTNFSSGSTHPLLGKAIATEAYSGLLAWASEIDVFTVAYLKDHRFQSSEEAVIPGAVYVEMGLALALHMFPDVQPHLHEVTFENLLTLSTNDVVRFCTRLNTTGKPGTRHGYQITTVEGNGNEVLVCKGSVSFDKVAHNCREACGNSNFTRITSIISRLSKQSLEIFNSERVKRRFDYGPQFTLITETWCSETEALCTIVLTEEIRSSLAVYVCHPAIIDACFQSLFLLKNSVEKPVPYGAADIKIYHSNITDVMYCHVINHVNNGMNNHVNNYVTNPNQTYDIVLMDALGNQALVIKEFKMVDLSKLCPTSLLTDVSYQIQWQTDTTKPEVDVESKIWLIVPDKCGFSEQFMNFLPPKDDQIFVFEFPGKSSVVGNKFLETLEKAFEACKSCGFSKVCIVSFLPVNNRSLSPDWTNFRQSHYQAFESSLLMLQTILTSGYSESVQFVFVTCESISLEVNDIDEAAFPWASTLLGFRRTVAEETTHPKVSVVDFPGSPTAADFQSLSHDLRKAEVPEEVVYRKGSRHLNQIRRLNSTQARSTTEGEHRETSRAFEKKDLNCSVEDEKEIENSEENCSVKTTYKDEFPSEEDRGSKAFKLALVSGQTCLIETGRSQPPKKHVEMKVLHAFPLLKEHISALSDSVAVCGKIMANNENDFANELVMKICHASELGNYITTEEKSLIRVDDFVFSSHEAAALSFPLALSFYIMHEIVCEFKGKRIVVWANEALQACVFACVALALDACVVCVVGTSDDKSMFKDFGFPRVLTECEVLSEDTESMDDLTCDVACFLNSPSQAVLQNILNNLRDSAKVISFDVNTTKYLDVSVRGNISFLRPKLEDITEDARIFEQLLTNCIQLLSDKGYLAKLKELPSRFTSIYDMVSSSKQMQNVTSGTESKSDTLAVSTISFSDENCPKEFQFSRLAFEPRCLKENKCYLVVGGIRGFGFEVALWLIENGAKTVVCTARSLPSESKMAAVARIEEETGARILLRQADVTSWEDMLGIVRELEGLSGLAGIVFTAMVLEDQRIKDADLETCARVVSTKVQGSVILHQLSLKFHLDFFIMFSSIAGIIGNVGQLAYSAANTFLDSLCDFRRKRLGLPALSVAWGTMGGAGILERSKDIASLFQSYGFRMMSCKQGLKFLEQFLSHHPEDSQIILCDIDWSTYLKSSAYILHESPRLQSLNEETRIPKIHDSTNGMTLDQLSGLDPGQRRKTVESFIRSLLSTWSEAEDREVDLNLALYKYGVDSIGAANMSLQIRCGLGAIFEIYHFIQPKTTGLSIINDTLQQIRSYEHDNLNTDQAINDAKLTRHSSDNCGKQYDLREYETMSEHHVEVVPLYVPDDAIVNVFMMHSSHRSAMANSPFATGFQRQETVALYSIGTKESLSEDDYDATVKACAKDYIKSIKIIQRAGPYYLAGFSFGGLLSYEVACQLTQDGEDVAMVAMLDTMPWFPKSTQDKNADFKRLQENLINDLQEKMVGRYLRSAALGRLGLTLEEFDSLMNELGTGEELILALDERAKKTNFSLDDVRDHVESLKSQSAKSCRAHFEWQPPEVRYDQTLLYILCQNVVDQPCLVWDPLESWGSLTCKFQIMSVLSSHFELLDQPYSKICGLLIMTTALMKRGSLVGRRFSPRSNHKERLIQFLKDSVNVLICSNRDQSSARLCVNDEEDELWIRFETNEPCKKIKIKLNDILNILPGKYAMVDSEKGTQQLDKNLTISLLLNSNQQIHIVCQDWQQRDNLLDAFEVLVESPLLRFLY